jgi:hypothetical protein
MATVKKERLFYAIEWKRVGRVGNRVVFTPVEGTGESSSRPTM